jgi:hypothetical protein
MAPLQKRRPVRPVIAGTSLGSPAADLTLPPRGDDFNPIVVGIVDEVDSHFFVFIAYATHLFMQGMSGGKIVHDKRQVKFIVPQVIGFFPVSHPGKFELMAGFAIAEKNKDEASVGGLFSADLSQLKSIPIEADALLQI